MSKHILRIKRIVVNAPRKKHTKSSEPPPRLPRKIQRQIDTIKSIRLEVSLLEDKLNRVRERTAKLLIRLPKHGYTRIDELLPVVYWSDPCLAQIARDVFKQLVGGVWPKTNREFTAICRECNEEILIQATSWSTHKDKINRSTCSNCSKAWEQRRKQLTQESRKWWKAERRERKRLRRMSYQQYLLTDHWKQFRYKALQRSGFRCQLCYSKKRLNVHHRTYKNRGHESYDDVIVLCRHCHAKFHDKLPSQEEGVE